jgi:hypothetical protein
VDVEITVGVTVAVTGAAGDPHEERVRASKVMSMRKCRNEYKVSIPKRKLFETHPASWMSPEVSL